MYRYIVLNSSIADDYESSSGSDSQDLNAMEFQFKDKQRPRPYVQSLTHSLHVRETGLIKP